MGANLDPATFWEITPREVVVILEGADARANYDLKTAQQMAYSCAVLIAIATHNPRKFPTFDKVFPDPLAKAVAQTPDEIFSAMSGWVEVVKTMDPQIAESD